MHLELISREPARLRHETPVLFVHGAWHGAWCWDRGFLDYFRDRGFAAHALSLRGHGASESRGPLRRTRLSHYVDDVARIAARLGSPPVVVGHSMGGAIVQKYLEKHPAHAGVLVASLPPAGVLRTAMRLHLRHPRQALKMHLTLSLYPLVEKPALVRELFFSETISDERLLHYSSLLQDESYAAFLDMLVLDLPRPKRVAAPMLVLGAENDTIFLPDQVEATAAAYRTNAVMFPDMAHDMMLEPGWEAVADAVISWLAEPGARRRCGRRRTRRGRPPLNPDIE